METVFLVCALVGATLLVAQMLLSAVGVGHHDTDVHVDHGMDGHHEVAHDHDHAWFVGLLTFRAIVAALMFFGLVGLASLPRFPEAPLAPLGLALAGGFVAMFGVSWIMRQLHRLRAEGTVRIDRALGQNGTVYLKVPGRKSGVGKVTLNLQNRTVEYQAVTNHDDLPTGAKVRVVGVISSDTLEVVPAPELERAAHV
jgi:hypothetical protein